MHLAAVNERWNRGNDTMNGNFRQVVLVEGGDVNTVDRTARVRTYLPKYRLRATPSTNRARSPPALVSGTFLCLAFLQGLVVVQESEHVGLGGSVLHRKTLHCTYGDEERKHTDKRFFV